MEEVADILEKAADLIETVGFVQGQYYKTDSDDKIIGFCALGAMSQATRNIYNLERDHILTGASAKACKAAEDTLRSAVKSATWNDNTIPEWNDDSTADVIIETLKQTAKNLRNAA